MSHLLIFICKRFHYIPLYQIMFDQIIFIVKALSIFYVLNNQYFILNYKDFRV